MIYLQFFVWTLIVVSNLGLLYCVYALYTLLSEENDQREVSIFCGGCGQEEEEQ